MKIPLNWLKEIVSLPKESKVLTDKLTMVGHMLDKKTILNGEEILDLELRSNRADCYSILGIAREVSALTGTKIKTLPTLELKRVNKLKHSSLLVKTDLVKRVMMTEVTNVKIIKSPKWLSNKLKSYGMESINNIVDLTNYVTIETGEPMHAFDLDKIKGLLEIKLANDKAKMTTFHNTEIVLSNGDLVWSQGNQVLSVAGAIGGKYHSISEITKNILVEAANYDRANIRKSVYRHNLLTEAGIRHEKDLDPNIVEGAIARFLYLLKKYGWGNPDGLVNDYYPKKIKPWKVKLDFEYLKIISGVEISISEIKKILIGLNFKIVKLDKTDLEVLVPTYRTDVKLEEDLIEEVLRIYGYDKIAPHVLSLEIPNEVTPDFIKQEENLRKSSIAVGFNEAITLSFVNENLSDLNVDPEKSLNKTAFLLNPPSPDTKNLRMNLLPNLYALAKKTIDERADEIRLFEIGKVYFKEGSFYKEKRKLGFAYYSLNNKSFLDFKSFIDSFFIKAGLPKPVFSNETFLITLTSPFKLELNNKNIGFGGIFKNIYYLEVDLDSILGLEKKYSVTLWPKYPPQIEDITFTFPDKTYIGDVLTEILDSSPLVKAELTTVFKDAYTFRINYQDPNKTLTDKDVEELREKIVKKVKDKFGGMVR